MNEHTNNEIHPEEQPEESTQLVADEGQQLESERFSSEETPTALAPEKFKLNLGQFAAGFLGWFLVTLLFYAQKMDTESLMICGGLLFLVNVVVLLILLIRLRSVGLGMLAALGVNLVISLLLGLTQNAFCFIPFYKR